jgi:hypothetical protein
MISSVLRYPKTILLQSVIGLFAASDAGGNKKAAKPTRWDGQEEVGCRVVFLYTSQVWGRDYNRCTSNIKTSVL